MIVPISLISVQEFFALKDRLLLVFNFNLFSNFSVFPSKLFTGVAQRLTIFISNYSIKQAIVASSYKKWLETERSSLFENFKLQQLRKTNLSNSPIPKYSSNIEISIGEKTIGKPLSLYLTKGNKVVYYHRSPNNFIRSHNYLPFYKGAKGENISKDHLKDIYLDSKDTANSLVGVIMSSLFFWNFETCGNCRNLTYQDIYDFRIKIGTLLSNNFLLKTVEKLMNDTQANSIRKARNQKQTGLVEYDEFYIKQSKPIIDQIDCLLAQHYGFTHEELDFIINYDIKYRMGADALAEGEE